MLEPRLHSVRLQAYDIERSREFYRSLGMNLSAVLAIKAGTYRFCNCTVGPIQFWLFECDGGVDRGDPKLLETQIELEIRSVTDTLESMKAAGIEPVRGATEVERSVWLRDPDGRLIVLSESPRSDSLNQ